MTHETCTITAEQLAKFSRISRKLREIIAKNKEIIKMHRDASSIRYGELK